MYLFLKGIHRHNYDGINIDSYNHLVVMRTGGEIEIIEKDIDLI